MSSDKCTHEDLTWQTTRRVLPIEVTVRIHCISDIALTCTGAEHHGISHTRPKCSDDHCGRVAGAGDQSSTHGDYGIFDSA